MVASWQRSNALRPTLQASWGKVQSPGDEEERDKSGPPGGVDSSVN